MPTRHFESFMLDGGSTKSEGKGILLNEHQCNTILGVKHKMGTQLALKSNLC